MQWYKFISYERNNPNALAEIEKFILDKIKKFAKVDAINENELKDHSPLQIQKTANNGDIIYFSSINLNVQNAFLNKYNAQPCDKPSSARAEGDGALRLIWGSIKS